MQAEELKMKELEKQGDWLYTLIIVLLALIGIIYIVNHIDADKSMSIIQSQIEKQIIINNSEIEIKYIKTNEEDYYQYKNYAIFSSEQLKKACYKVNFFNSLIDYINPPKENINYLMNLGTYSKKELLKNNTFYKIKPSFAENIACDVIKYNKIDQELIYKNKYVRIAIKQ